MVSAQSDDSIMPFSLAAEGKTYLLIILEMTGYTK